MFATKYFVMRQRLLKKLPMPTRTTAVFSVFIRSQEFKTITACSNSKQQYEWKYRNHSPYLLHCKWYSKQPDALEICDLDLKRTKDLFPEPRMILNNLSAKRPEKVFDVYYKQFVTPKGVKKKSQNLDWTCTYNFIWPEKMKFEYTALSKRQAGEQAATQALHWLLTIKRIDKEGSPIYDKEAIKQARSELNDPIHATVGANSMETVEKIWKEYECGIREIYEKTATNARHVVINEPVQVTKDSTIDEDGFSETGNYHEETPDFPDSSKGVVHPVYGRVLIPPSHHTLKRREEAIGRMFQNYDDSLTPLPIDEYADNITSTLNSTRVAVIVGAPGCGKSTRVPAMVLRQCGVASTVVVSEPRRVAAIGLAERVASEMGEEVGDSVGYQVRLNSKPPKPPAGSILFCTSGILLNRLQANPGLTGCSHVLIDEAHERDINTDVTLLLLKRALSINQQLKIVIMSATIDTDVFTRYFGSCPIIRVPGRTFPVEVSYLQDIERKYNIQLTNTLANCERDNRRPQINITEIVETIKAVDTREKEGAILVFLPGWAEIKQAKQMLDAFYRHSGTHMILPVHSRLSTTDQSKMFAIPPPGIRKIVLATNVAETSVTIPDVVHVVDAGTCRENTIRQETGTASLETAWVSLAGAKQRSGRAGRIQPGHCYRLYTREKEEEFEPHTTPEILRVPLDKTVLDCKSYAPGDKAQDFLSQLPEPPSDSAVVYAVNDLIDIGALTPSEQLTRLGKALSTLQLSPRVGLSLVHASVLGTAVAAANVVAHTDVQVFHNAADRRDEIREIKRKFCRTSDHAALHWIQVEFERELGHAGWQAVDHWCQRYQLKKERLAYVKSLSNLYLSQLLKTGFIEPTLELEEMTQFSDIDELAVASIISGVNALLVSRKRVNTKGKMRTVHEMCSSTGDKAQISSESVNHGITKQRSRCIVTYSEGRHSAERRALLVNRSSAISAHCALLCTRGHVHLQSTDDETTILSLPRHKLHVHVPTDQADTLLRTRDMLWSTLQYYIDRDIRNLDYDEYTLVSKFKTKLVKAVGRILVEGQEESFGTNR